MTIKNEMNEVTDATPITGVATDVAPLGRSGKKPAHELTADEDVDVAPWDRVVVMEEFRQLLLARRKFIVPATIFFVTYYFALPLLVGYAPKLMEKRVLGVVNLAYLFALSQFFMAWIIAALYVRAADRFDAMAKYIISQVTKGEQN